MSFVWPLFFLVIPLPWLVRRWLPPARSTTKTALKIPFFDEVVTADPSTFHRSIPKARSVLCWLIWVLLVTAAARPVEFAPPVRLQREGRDVMMLIDLSGSMNEKDMQWEGRPVTRMALVRRVTRDFIQRRRGDRVGAIVFGSQAYLQAPLTFDLDTVQQLLDETEVGLAGQKTAIGDAIGMAVRHLKDKHSGEKVVILLTDGSNTAGHVRPDDAARVAADTGIRIHTIAFGADQMIIQDPFWGRRQVNPSQDLDETLMKSIASLTGGRYFRAKNQDEIEEAFELIDRIEPVDRDEAYIRPQIERYAWPLAAALALSVVIVLGEWRRERGRSGLPTDKEAVS